MTYMWFKSHEDDLLEDCGFVVANNKSEAHAILMNEQGYDNTTECIDIKSIDEMLGYIEQDSLSLFKLYNSGGI